MRIVCIATQSPYLGELKRSAVLSDLEIAGIVSRSDQLQQFFQQETIDCYVLMDQNLPEPLDAYLDRFQQADKLSSVLGLLVFAEDKKPFENHGIPCILQSEVSPMDFIEGLETQKIHPGAKSRKEHLQEEKEALDGLERRDGFTQEQVDQTRRSYADIQPDPTRSTQETRNTEPKEEETMQQIDTTHQFQQQFGQPALPTQATDPMEASYQRRQNQATTQPIYANPGYQNPNTQATAIQFKPITVCLNSPKGGVGKTTLAIELSSLIALRAGELDMNEVGHLSYNKRIRVCLVDLNPSFDTMAATLSSIYSKAQFTTVSDWFQAIDQKIVDTLDDKTRRDVIRNGYQGISQYLEPNKIHFTQEEVERLLVIDPDTGLAILPSIALPLDASLTRPEYLRVILNTLKEFYDVVLIDTGNNISFFTLEAMRASDEILLVCSKSKGAAATVQKLMKSLADMKNPVDPQKFNLVLNSPNGPDSVYTSQSFSSILHMKLVAEIPYDERVRIAHEDGHVFSIYNKKSDFAKACVKLAQSICPLWIVVPNRNEPRKKRKKRRGFFGLFGR